MVHHGCLSAVILCIDDSTCGHYASLIVVMASELQESSEIILCDFNITLLLRALRDIEVSWKECICVAIAHATRWPVLPTLTDRSVELIYSALFRNFCNGSSRSPDSLNKELNSSLLNLPTYIHALVNVAGKKDNTITTHTLTSSVISAENSLQYLLHVFANCIGRETIAVSFFGNTDHRENILNVIEGSLQGQVSLAQITGSSYILYNCTLFWPDWNINTISKFTELLGLILKNLMEIHQRFSGFQCSIQACELIRSRCALVNTCVLHHTLETYSIEFRHLEQQKVHTPTFDACISGFFAGTGQMLGELIYLEAIESEGEDNNSRKKGLPLLDEPNGDHNILPSLAEPKEAPL